MNCNSLLVFFSIYVFNSYFILFCVLFLVLCICFFVPFSIPFAFGFTFFNTLVRFSFWVANLLSTMHRMEKKKKRILLDCNVLPAETKNYFFPYIFWLVVQKLNFIFTTKNWRFLYLMSMLFKIVFSNKFICFCLFVEQFNCRTSNDSILK